MTCRASKHGSAIAQKRRPCFWQVDVDQSSHAQQNSQGYDTALCIHVIALSSQHEVLLSARLSSGPGPRLMFLPVV